MTYAHGEGGNAIAETVSRLRQIQEDFADEPPEMRQQHLREEIERSIAPLMPDQREAFLAELMARLPWSGAEANGVNLGPRDRSTATAPATTEEADPEALADRLIEQAGAMDESAREQLIAKLAAGGLVNSTPREGVGGNISGTAADELKTLLRIKREQELRTQDLVELLLELMPFVKQSSHVSWRIWRDFSSGSQRRTPSDLTGTFQQYLAEEKRVTREQVRQTVDHNQKLNASLLQSLSVIPKISAQIVERFSPSKIERMAKLDQSHVSIFKRKPLPEACWETFKSLAAKHDADAIEREMKHLIAEYVEDYLRLHGAGKAVPGEE